MKKTLILPTLLLIATSLLSILIVPPPATADDDIDWETAPPSVIHQKLWEAKASAYMNKQLARKLASAGIAENTQTNYDIKYHDIYIRVDDTTEIIYGRVTFLAAAAEDGVTEIQIDFFDNMTIDSIVAPSGPLSYTRANNVVTVTLDGTYNTGEEFTFDFYYHGHPTEGGFQAFSFDTRFGKKVISSLSEPYYARTWWPCKDRMDDKPDSFDIAIEVDTAFFVGSNGSLDSVVENGGNTHTFYYSVRYPMVTYLFSVAISEYTVWYDEWVYNGGADTMPIINAVYPDRYTYSLGKFNVTPGAITVFSESYGQYPFVNEKYGHANFEWGGAMEHQTMSSMSGTDFGFSTPVVVHELSHQWWGDMITCKQWGHIWLNEGWASYSEALYYLETEGWASYHNYMNGMRYLTGGTIYVYDTTNVWNIFSSIVYDKGAWVVHMLRGVLGDSLFFAGVDAYYHSEYQHAAATTEEFRDVFENATGVELDWFFDEWIYGTYYPNYQFTYWQEPSDTGGYDVFLRVAQLQTSNPQVFTMPVDFFFDVTSGTDDTVTLWVDQRTKMFKLNFPSSLNNIQLDPSDWILKAASSASWRMYIVTLNEELREASQYLTYVDTIEVRGGTGSNTWSITGGALPSGFSIDNNGIISGTTGDTGTFTFTVHVDDNGSTYSDEAEFTIHVAPTTYTPGDVDNSGSVNVGDLTYLVNFLYKGGPAPTILNAADVDASCEINAADLTYMVNYLFKGGPAPLEGCVL